MSRRLWKTYWPSSRLESTRYRSSRVMISAVAASSALMYRLALRPFTFSNGVTIPASTLIAAPPSAIHMDENLYSNAEQFDGFRFSNARDMDEDVTTTKYSTVSISPEHLVFGLGRHACPGRFFAVNEIKTMVARIIMSYDVKFDKGQEVPRAYRMSTFRVVQNANLLFRKRQM